MMHQSDDGHDLEFATSVDGSVQQNVPVPSQTNSVLSNMINSSAGGRDDAPSPSSYTPSASIPGLQFSQSAHPTACLFHILFKGMAFTLYILGSKLMEDIMVTVLCILLLAADFWVVKNITGRLLVGLRWWNKVDPVTGNTSWIFESAAPTVDGQKARMNAFDSKFFWSVLYLTPALWGLLFLSAILWLQFQCFVTVTCAVVLSASNVYGYYKCSSDQKEKWSQWMNQGAQMGMSAMMRGGVFGWLGSRLSGGGGGSMQQVPQNDGTFA
ncbi:hypothetical protein ACHAXT_007767 [Thalassiosira profunda]